MAILQTIRNHMGRATRLDLHTDQDLCTGCHSLRTSPGRDEPDLLLSVHI